MPKACILIVDDDPGITETMADILSDMGYGVDAAADGYRAIDMTREAAYDFAIIDIRMPGINGVDTLKAIKNINPSIKVVVMTAHSVEGLVKEALKEGAYGIFYKPLDMDKVLDFIKKLEQGCFILLVDDDPAFCETLKDTLIEKGCRVDVAHSGEEAVARAKEKPIDVVFIDT